jgi:hypothetical protein
MQPSTARGVDPTQAHELGRDSQNDAPERLRRRFDRPPLVARVHLCGAMARLIEQPNDHRLPARHPAGFFVSGEFQ